MRIDGRRVSREKLERIRIESVRLVLRDGRTPTQAARAMGVDRRRVFGWLALHRAGGWQALRSRKASGRPTRLTDNQVQWVYSMVTAKRPFQLKVPFALWTRSRIRTLIMRKFAIRLSPVTVGRLKARLGFVCPAPLFRANRRNAAAIDQWTRNEYPALRARAKREGAEIFFLVESVVKPRARASTSMGGNEADGGDDPALAAALNMICVVTPRSAMRFMVVRGRVTSVEVKEFLKRLMHARRRSAHLIAEGLPSQRSKRVQDYVDSLDGRLRLDFLPPAARVARRR
jgi:transposase